MLHWYSPSRKTQDTSREEYGRGAWSPDTNTENRRQPDQGIESMDAVCMTFPKLRSGSKLPQAVWTAVEKQALLSEFGDEDDE